MGSSALKRCGSSGCLNWFQRGGFGGDDGIFGSGVVEFPPVMAGRPAIPVHSGEEGGGPCAGREVEQLRRHFREVILPEFVPVLRTMIQEEMRNVHLGCTCQTPRVASHQNQPSITNHSQLHFNDELPDIIFTGNTVEPKGNAPVQIFITDADNRKITSGPLSKIKIEILVLDGDFGDEEASWTEEEFNKHMLRERKGRGPLLQGNRFITLEGGVGNLCGISFTDNSKWTRTQKFRLGARALQAGLANERIQEAISEAFYVNDRRGEYTMKHHTPSLEDEVWRLTNIRKDGPYHKRLVEQGIRTVEDFLKSLVMDQGKLCSILFGKRIPNKKWKTIVQHAWKCDLGRKRYSYVDPGQRGLVNRLNHVDYENQNAMAELNDPTHTLSGFRSVLATSTPETNPTDLHHTNVRITHEDTLADASDPSFPCCIEDSNHVEGQQQTCFAIEGGNVDGALDWNTRGCGTESCSNMFKVQHKSWNNPPTPISHSKWVKLRFTIKLGTAIKKRISARKSARIKQIGWFGLVAAVRFGRSIRKRAAATRIDHLLNRQPSWSHGLSPLPFIYPIWPQEEDSYF